MNDEPIGYRALATTFQVLSDRVDVLELFDRLWAPARVAGDSQHTIEVVDEPDGWLLGVDGQLSARAVPDELILERAQWEINRLARDSMNDRPLLHAGCVEVDGLGVVVCGASGHGKSTLVLGLCERGARYLSDEIAAVRPEAVGIVDWYPKPLTLRRGSREFTRELVPNSAASVAHLMADTWLVPVPEVVASTQARLTVLVDYDPHGPDSLVPIEPADALGRLADHTHGLAQRGGALFHSLAEFARSVPCAVLQVSDLERACELVESHLDGIREAS